MSDIGDAPDMQVDLGVPVSIQIGYTSEQVINGLCPSLSSFNFNKT